MSKNRSSRSARKHTRLSKTHWGLFGRNELGIVGAPCSAVRQLAERLIERLSNTYNLAYADAEHAKVDEPDRSKSCSALARHAEMIYTEKQQSASFDYRVKMLDYQKRVLFNEQDLVFVNGNHFPVESQIVIIDQRKALQGKQDKLTDVQFIILQEETGEIPAEIKQMLGNKDSIPVYRMSETEEITRAVKQFIEDRTPSLSGLVLAGGESRRMHTDKTVLEYHGKPQRRHLYELLDGFCDQVFLSCRQDQVDSMPGHFNTIPDSFIGIGPVGGLLSAFRLNPHTAWLAVACDLPLLSHRTLEYLVANRNPSKIATAFVNRESSFPEPLITIWEPKSYPVLLHFLSMGYSCPGKTLINSEIELLEAPDPSELTNVNRPDEYREVLETLTSH